MDDREFVPNHVPSNPRPPVPNPKNNYSMWQNNKEYNGHVPGSPRPAPAPQPIPAPKG